MKFEEIKGSIDSFLDSVAEGWRHLRESAANALTRFLSGEKSRLPPKSEIDDPLYLPVRGWSMLGGEVFEDDILVVSGEKRFERESTEGRWRVMQCAYGSFRRVVPLSFPVLSEDAKASYKNGVLRVELRKARPGKSAPKTIKVE